MLEEFLKKHTSRLFRFRFRKTDVKELENKLRNLYIKYVGEDILEDVLTYYTCLKEVKTDFIFVTAFVKRQPIPYEEVEKIGFKDKRIYLMLFDFNPMVEEEDFDKEIAKYKTLLLKARKKRDCIRKIIEILERLKRLSFTHHQN